MRSALRPLGIPGLAALAAVLAAGFLFACGGSDATTTGASRSNETTAQGAGTGGQDGSKASGNRNRSRGEGSKAKKGDGSGGAGKGSGGSSSAAASTPLRVSGGGSAQFRVKGGDNSIQEFGEEGDESELHRAAQAVHGFYVALASEDWAGACSYVARSLVSQFEQLAAQSPQLEGKGCPPVLHAFTAPMSPSLQREITTIDAGSLRHDGEQAFLIYHGAPGKTVYAMPLTEEDGEWKVTAISATALG